MWKKRKTDNKKEEKEESLLKELCGDDAELYDFLARKLYMNPIAAMRAHGISEKDLEILTGEARKSIKDKNYEEAMRKYGLVVDKALFEATQNLGERGRFIKTIQDVSSRAVRATENAKEKAEKEGLTDHATSLEKRIEHYKFMSERIDDVVNVAAHFYNEKLAIHEDVERRKARIEKIQAMKTEETEEARGEAERREARQEARKEMGREARREAWGDKERQQARQKKRREARRKELE